jgi:hypothetical protein
MLNIIVPNVVIQAFSIIFPIATWDLTALAGFTARDIDFLKTQGKDVD